MSLESRMLGDLEKFWMTPELFSKLFPYLDLKSIKNLAEYHALTRKILRNAFTWNKLIKRTFPEDSEVNVKPYGVPYEYDELLASEKPKAKLLAEILSLILEYPGSWVLEMDLIHHVCQRYPQSVPTSRVDVNCACLETHVVSPRGIVLLGEIQAILGSRLLEVDTYQGIFVSGPLLTTLSSMATRQQGTRLKLRPFLPTKFEVSCWGQKDAEAFETLASSIESVRVTIFADYVGGVEGWAALRRAVEQMEDSSAVQEIHLQTSAPARPENCRCTTLPLALSRDFALINSQEFRENMAAIWKKVFLWRVFKSGWYLVFSKEMGEERGLKGLADAYNMTSEEFRKEAQQSGGGGGGVYCGRCPRPKF